MITAQTLERRGYLRYDGGHRHYTDFFYQRSFRDQAGIRFIIEFWHYPHVSHDTSALCESWQGEVTLAPPHVTLQFHFASDLDYIEEKAAQFWQLMGGVYYEQNESIHAHD